MAWEDVALVSAVCRFFRASAARVEPCRPRRVSLARCLTSTTVFEYCVSVLRLPALTEVPRSYTDPKRQRFSLLCRRLAARHAPLELIESINGKPVSEFSSLYHLIEAGRLDVLVPLYRSARLPKLQRMLNSMNSGVLHTREVAQDSFVPACSASSANTLRFLLANVPARSSAVDGLRSMFKLTSLVLRNMVGRAVASEAASDILDLLTHAVSDASFIPFGVAARGICAHVCVLRRRAISASGWRWLERTAAGCLVAFCSPVLELGAASGLPSFILLGDEPLFSASLFAVRDAAAFAEIETGSRSWLAAARQIALGGCGVAQQTILTMLRRPRDISGALNERLAGVLEAAVLSLLSRDSIGSSSVHLLVTSAMAQSTRAVYRAFMRARPASGQRGFSDALYRNGIVFELLARLTFLKMARELEHALGATDTQKLTTQQRLCLVSAASGHSDDATLRVVVPRVGHPSASDVAVAIQYGRRAALRSILELCPELRTADTAHRALGSNDCEMVRSATEFGCFDDCGAGTAKRRAEVLAGGGAKQRRLLRPPLPSSLKETPWPQK